MLHFEVIIDDMGIDSDLTGVVLSELDGDRVVVAVNSRVPWETRSAWLREVMEKRAPEAVQAV